MENVAVVECQLAIQCGTAFKLRHILSFFAATLTAERSPR
jgi:hypothetical protein